MGRAVSDACVRCRGKGRIVLVSDRESVGPAVSALAHVLRADEEVSVVEVNPFGPVGTAFVVPCPDCNSPFERVRDAIRGAE